jgi:hypothetical protein
MNICPERAIEAAHGYIIGLLILLNTLFQSFVYIWLLNHNLNWFSNETRYGFIWRMFFETVVTFIALVLSYRVIHYLRRFKIFDWIITYTSLTKLKFWGRYKPPKDFE